MINTKTLFTLLIVSWVLCVSCYRNAQHSSNPVIINGDFEQELSVGWTQNNSELSYSDIIERAAGFDSDDNYELAIEKASAGHIKLLQTINVSSLNLQFSARAKMNASEQNPSATDYWAAAAICLRYLNNNYGLLGETRISFASPNCPWTNSNVFHLIGVSNDNWQTHSFNVNNELANLPGVNLADIKKIQVVLMDTTNGC